MTGGQCVETRKPDNKKPFPLETVLSMNQYVSIGVRRAES